MRYEEILRTLRVKSERISGLRSQFVMALPGTFAEFGMPFNTTVNTEKTAAYAKTYDLGTATYKNIATSAGAPWTANYQIFPDAEAIGDYAIFGHSRPFGMMYFDMSATAATYGADSITWKYWNGTAWSALTILFDTTNTTPAAGGVRPFMQDGYIVFSAPSDWEAKTIDSQSAYWVMAYVNAAQITQIPLTNSKNHYLVSATTATEAPCNGVIKRGRFTFHTASGATADSNIILCNLWTGKASAIKTLTKALKSNEVADFNLQVDKDDSLVIFGTDEDGTTEFADGMVELEILRG